MFDTFLSVIQTRIGCRVMEPKGAWLFTSSSLPPSIIGPLILAPFNINVQFGAK